LKRNIIFLTLLCVMLVMFCGSVSAADVPSANFTSNVTNGTAPLNVQFNDTSNGTPTSWSWDFGDGSNSTDENPVHNYTKAGTYSVSLTAGNDAGNSTITQTNYITVLLNDAYVSPTGSDITGDGTTTSPYATIQKALNNLVTGGTIHLASGTYTGTGNKAITFTKNVTVVGEDQTSTIIDATNSGNIFTINSGFNVTVANLTFANGNSTTYGGAIYNSGNTTVSNCTFTGNTAMGSGGIGGGAIYNHNYGTLNVNNSTFKSNKMITTTSTYAGAIFGDSNSITSVSNCTFIGNTAVNGGAIWSRGTLIVTGSTFQNNTAAGSNSRGGAIFVTAGGVATVHYNSFLNNTAATSGSAIFLGSGTVNAEYNWWGSNNSPSSQVYGNVDYSNWLYMTETVNPTTIVNGSTATVTVSFNNVCNGTNVTNIDPVSGHILDGTLVSFSSTSGSFSPVAVTTSNGTASTTFTATTLGNGTVNATTDNQTLSSDVIINSNTGIVAGNVTCVSGGNVNLTATLTDGNGIGVSGETVTFTVNGTSYTATTDSNGLATVEINAPGTAGVYNVTASFAGDSLYQPSSNNGTSYLTVQLQDAYVSPTGNDTSGDGSSSNPYATIQKALNNIVTGGTVHVRSGTYTGTGNYGITLNRNVTIVGDDQTSTIINAAKLGNIFTINSGVNVTITNLTLENGTASYGGAINNVGNLNVTNCTFTNNAATSTSSSYGGGAIYNAATITLDNCNFTGNTARSGGAIYSNGNLTVSNSVITNSTGKLYGGAIFNGGYMSSINNCTFSSNNGYYGILYNSGNLTVNNSVFSGNSASMGGVIYSKSNLVVSYCNFTDNNATGKGGAIYSTGDLNVNYCNFTNNSSPYGGAICGAVIIGTNPITNISNCTFTGNTASYVGGAIYNSGTLNLHYNSFVNNTASTNNGNTIYSASSVNAEYNWWGTNNNPASQIYGTVDYSNWIYMTEIVDPTTIVNGSTGTVTVSFNNVWNGTGVSSIDPVSGHIPDGTVVNFSSSVGSFNPVTALTTNGVATTTFTSASDANEVINATTDGQTILVGINKLVTNLSVGNVTALGGQTVNLTATLTDANGNPVSGKPVTFTVNGTSYTVTTDVNGVATLSHSVTENVGVYPVTVSFLGDTGYLDCTNNATSLAVLLGVSANVTGGYYNTTQVVGLTSNDGNATIYYAINGGNLTPYTGAITINSTSTLSYVAMDSINSLYSPVYTQTYTIDTTAPVVSANVPGKLYNSTQTVTLTATDDVNTTIYYTTDGTDPQTSGTRTAYTGPITIANTTTLRYTAVDDVGNWAAIQTQTYTIDTIAPVVTANETAGAFNTTQSVALTSDDSNATIYYTTDGSDPASSSSTRTQYTGPITINTTTTLKYTAVDDAGNWAATQTQTYVIDTTVPTVDANVTSGIFNTTQSVTLTATDDTNTTIYYTTDGSDPQTSGTRTAYAGPITVANNTTLEYTAVDDANNWAVTQTQTYVIDTIVPTVDANVTSGIFNTNQSVALNATDDTNTTIYYTIDGTDPTTSSTKYTGPITISNTTTLKYLAVDVAGNVSSIYTQTYTIDTTVPTVNVVDPANNVVNVAVNKVIKVTFSEAIKAGNSWIELKNSNGTVIPITWLISGNVLTVTANSTLAHGVKHTLLIHTGSVTDLAGNNVAGYVSRFTTSTDATAPVVKTVDPANNAVNVAANKVIKVTFSEAIKAGNSWIELVTSNGTVVPSTFSISGNVLTIKANSTLTHGVKYMVLIHTGSVTDLVGNNVAGYVSHFTVDTVAPAVKSVDPVNNAVKVATSKVIKVTFSEAVKAGNGSIEVVSSNGTSVPVKCSFSGNVLTITPSSALNKGVKYTVLIHTGSVTDLAGNNVAGYVTRFTTTA
jgi:predicted outer membrane repeat protein